MLYRKKPIAIEAVQIHENAEELKAFIGKSGDVHTEAGSTITQVVIHTLEGDMAATEGDYIIKGVKGEFYPCRKDIFEETYEAVEEYDCQGN